MSNETLKPVRTIGLLTIIAGIVLMLGGATTWFVVTDQLKAANITVAEDADYFADTPVRGPLTALSQAAIIDKHALAAAGGKTYAELDREDPARVTAMNASFLRASLGCFLWRCIIRRWDGPLVRPDRLVAAPRGSLNVTGRLS